MVKFITIAFSFLYLIGYFSFIFLAVSFVLSFLAPFLGIILIVAVALGFLGIKFL